MTEGPRARIVASAARRLRERGLARTGLRDVVADASAPWGSLAHYFPGGKEQIATEAAEWMGSQVRAHLDRAARADDPVAAVRAFAGLWQDVVHDTGGRAGCTIAALVADADDAALAMVAARIFAAWRQPLVATLVAHGVAPGRAQRLSTMVIASLEGALVLSRAERSADPLIEVGLELETMVASALRRSV